jgi:hypothetical protein
MHLLPNALHHLTLQARDLHCSGCHFELTQLSFTAAYRARQCLLISRNTFILILRAGLLQPHGSESGTWHNRDLIRRHACANASSCWNFAEIDVADFENSVSHGATSKRRSKAQYCKLNIVIMVFCCSICFSAFKIVQIGVVCSSLPRFLKMVSPALCCACTTPTPIEGSPPPSTDSTKTCKVKTSRETVGKIVRRN